ncbi:hypothetical protein, partial [Streptomyces sp. NPDC005131]
LAQRQNRATRQAITDRLRSLTATTPLGLIHLALRGRRETRGEGVDGGEVSVLVGAEDGCGKRLLQVSGAGRAACVEGGDVARRRVPGRVCVTSDQDT